MSSWRSGRGLQWQPLKLWWTPCPRGLRQCWKIMVATQNIDTLGPIWTFSLRSVLTFVASGLDINGCVLSYFEGTANLHCYTSCTLTTLHCSKVSFLQCCHMKRYNKIFTKMWGVYSLLRDTVHATLLLYNSAYWSLVSRSHMYWQLLSKLTLAWNITCSRVGYAQRISCYGYLHTLKVTSVFGTESWVYLLTYT